MPAATQRKDVNTEIECKTKCKEDSACLAYEYDRIFDICFVYETYNDADKTVLFGSFLFKKECDVGEHQTCFLCIYIESELIVQI